MIAILPAAVSPLFVARLSALPMTSVEELTSDDLRDAIRQNAIVTAELESASAPASDILYRLVSEAPNSETRAALLRLRRDLFNGRRARPKDLAMALEVMAASERVVVERMHSLLEARSAIYDRLCDANAAAVTDSRRRLTDVLKDERFAHGVLLSSPALHVNFARYARSSGATPKARDAQVERGILRYLTRAAAKATPFGSFCKVSTGRLVTRAEDATVSADLYDAIGSWSEGPRVVRLNKLLYATLWSVLRERPAVRAILRLELNPTIHAEGATLSFVANVEGRELIQRLENTEAIAAIIEVVRTRGKIRCAELVACVAHDAAIDATVEEVTDFVNALADVGLLRFRSPVRSQDAEWAAGLHEAIKIVDDEVAAAVRSFLELAIVVTHEYAVAPTTQRARLGERLALALVDVLAVAGRPADDFTELLLLEDCGANGTMEICATRDTAAALDTLAELVRRLLPMANPRSDMATLRHYYDKRYPHRNDGVPLLELYESYFREHLKEHLQRLENRMFGKPNLEPSGYDIANPFALPLVTRIRDAGRAWSEVIRERWVQSPNAEEICISLDECPGAELLADDAGADPRSVSLFCQLARGTKSTRVVLPSAKTLLGFGKYYSRFLHLFPNEFTQLVRDENIELGGERVAEIAGDANHNANLHPPLLPLEIAYPTGDSDIATGAIPWNTCVVVPDIADPNAVALLRARDGPRIYPADLGFTNQLHRPALFRFLMTFSPRSAVGVIIPGRLEPIGHGTESRILYRPRVVIGGHVVIARRMWSVPSTLFPARRPDEAVPDYLIRIHQWRTQLGMPARIYVRVQPHAVPVSAASVKEALAPLGETAVAEEYRLAPDEQTAALTESPRPAALPRSSRDYHKPQFIDLESPLLIDLFSRVPGPLQAFTAHIEEQYPTSDQLPNLDGQAHAVELVLQMQYAGNGA